MKNEKIYLLGKNLGLTKNEINDTLKYRFASNNTIHSDGYNCYKSGTMYGVISTKDL